MSRGYGAVQRDILALLESYPAIYPWRSGAIADMLSGHYDSDVQERCPAFATRSQHESVRRAIKTLAKAKAVETRRLTWHWIESTSELLPGWQWHLPQHPGWGEFLNRFPGFSPHFAYFPWAPVLAERKLAFWRELSRTAKPQISTDDLLIARAGPHRQFLSVWRRPTKGEEEALATEIEEQWDRYVGILTDLLRERPDFLSRMKPDARESLFSAQTTKS